MLFCTHCTIYKNLFDLIIDNKSCINIIGKYIIDKLKLSQEPHLEPYKILHIKLVREIKVNQRCRIPFFFSIGKYKDAM
jgi:hypothetical protein